MVVNDTINQHLLSLVLPQVMSFTDEFRGLDRDIEGSPKRWKKLVESECPEKEKFPQEWKGKSSLQKLIMMRALRPDRMTYALRLILIFLLSNCLCFQLFIIPHNIVTVRWQIVCPSCHLRQMDRGYGGHRNLAVCSHNTVILISDHLSVHSHINLSTPASLLGLVPLAHSQLHCFLSICIHLHFGYCNALSQAFNEY